MTVRAAAPRIVLGLALAGAALWLFADRARLDPALLETAVRDLGRWAPLAHIALFALGTLLFVPGALFGLAGGALFGPLWGTALNLVGATLGATAAFLVGRYVAGDWVRRRAGPLLTRLMAGVEAETAKAIAAMKEKGLLAVEMEAAALYAFAKARDRSVLCFAHVTNRMGRTEGDSEKGEADGTVDALSVIVAAARRFIEQGAGASPS